MPSFFRRRLLAASACALAASAAAAPLTAAATPYPPGATGYDISWPQCGGPLPAPSEVAVVGVNDGHPYTANPCFAQEWAWAAPSQSASVYINLDRSATDVAAHGNSAYTDGWSAAAFSASVVASQGAHPAMWWLDVETTGDWSCGATCDTAADADVVRGALDFLRSQGMPAGIYSNPAQWAIIAGGYAPGVAVWTTDYDDSQPLTHCGAADSFAGGTVALVQLLPAVYDRDQVCATPDGILAPSLGIGASTGLVGGGGASGLAAQAPDGSLFYDWNSDGVSAWNRTQIAPPRSGYSAPTVTRAPSSTLVTAEGADNSLQLYWNADGDPAWHRSQIEGGRKAYSAPAVARAANATLVAVQGSSNSLSFYWNVDGQDAWNFAQVAGSGTAYSAPAIAREPNATLLAVRGPQNSLSSYWNADGEASWNFAPIDGGGRAFSTPAIARQSNATLVAVQGRDNSLSYYWNSDGQALWNFEQIDGSARAYSAPAIARQSNATLVAVKGPSNSLSFYWNTDAQPGWPRVTAAADGSTSAFRQ